MVARTHTFRARLLRNTGTINSSTSFDITAGNIGRKGHPQGQHTSFHRHVGGNVIGRTYFGFRPFNPTLGAPILGLW